MKKCIYKITNLVNNKVYIGQTNDFDRRKREHKNKMYGRCSKILYNAITKYGWDNFSMEIIEDYCEDYNEKEKFWIKKYDSQKNGYNVDLTLIQSENNIYIDETMLAQIFQDLRNNTLTYREIADKYDISAEQTIRDINRGITHYTPNISYPIRPLKGDLAHEKAILIIEDLKNTKLTMRELAEKYNCSQVYISNINTGSRCFIETEEYPIRKETRKGKRFSEDIIDEIYYDIINTSYTWDDLAKKYNCGTKVFQHINQGQTHKREGYEYPLRSEKNVRGAKKALQIIHLLKTTDWTYNKIAEELETNITTVRHINYGEVHKQKDETYPIRK